MTITLDSLLANLEVEQVDKYLHVMVYGEYVTAPAVTLCKSMAENLPDPLETTYLVNSGTEAIEGAIKLARRYTGRSELIAAKNAYHGNTMGSLSLSEAIDFEAKVQLPLSESEDCRNAVAAFFRKEKPVFEGK